MTLTRQSIHRLVLRQRRLVTALLAVACLLLSLVVPTSCVEPLTPEQKLDYLSKDLTLRFYLPGNGIATKAVPGNVESINPESRIYNVQVWAFNHADPSATGEALAAIDAETAVAYTEAYNIAWNNTSQLPNGSNYYAETYWDGAYTLEVPMRIPGYILDRPAADMKFDFYVLANASSVSRTVAINATRKQIKEASFGYTSATSDPFGPNGPKYGATPIAAINGGASNGPGLPISGFFNKDKTGAATGVDLSFLQGSNYASMTPAQVHEQLPIVQLERAVSKLRFVFAKQGNTAGVQITKIEVNSGMIPDQTFLFPREDGKFVLPEGSSYMTAVTTISGIANSDILAVDNPELLRSDCTTNGNATKTAQEYEAFLNEAVGSTTATQRYVYLRESGLPLSCTIYYKLSDGGAEQQATFSMSQITGYDATTTNFHRNHYWTVYAYFKGGGLYIKPVVLPWYDGSNYTYTQRGSAIVAISDDKQALFGYGWTTSHENSWWQQHQAESTEWYFRRQDPDYTDNWQYDWLHSQMVSAPGCNAGGVPIYANRIELQTSGFNVPLRLKLSNPEDFFIVTYNVSSGEYRSSTDATGAEIPLAIAQGGTTYFYVLPKDGDHADKVTEAYLVTAPTNGSASQKLPFNAGVFPGSNENTEINFYSVSVTDFKNYYDKNQRPDNIRIYDSSHWLQTL